MKSGGLQLLAASLVLVTISIPVDTISTMLARVANKGAYNATCRSADRRATPAIADNATDDRAGACTDCGPPLCLRA
jgi:hypothetical protein